MDETQKKHVELYASLMNEKLSSTKSVGRYEMDSDKDPYICEDILQKLDPVQGCSVLDIGCGVGGVTPLLLARLKQFNCEIYLMDIKEVIAHLKEMPWIQENPKIHLIEGVFPEASALNNLRGLKLDRILTYSVLHYTSQPETFVEAAMNMLAPGGKLFIGDLPNVNKKGRFLATQAGREFDASYKKVDISRIPVFKTHEEYVKSSYNTQNLAISDEFLLNTFKKYRAEGANVFVLPHPENLPFSKTREDLLIVKERA